MLNQRANKIAARALAASFALVGTIVGASQGMAMDNLEDTPYPETDTKKRSMYDDVHNMYQKPSIYQNQEPGRFQKPGRFQAATPGMYQAADKQHLPKVNGPLLLPANSTPHHHLPKGNGPSLLPASYTSAYHHLPKGNGPSLSWNQAPESNPMAQSSDYFLEEKPNIIIEALKKNVESLQYKVESINKRLELNYSTHREWYAVYEERDMASEELNAAINKYIEASTQDNDEFRDRMEEHMNNILKN